MLCRHLVALTTYLFCSVCIAGAQETADHTDKIENAIHAVFPNRPYYIWGQAGGDLNGDGIEDVAAVVVSNDDLPQEDRLLILAGNKDGSYNPISVSGEYCGVRKFYNLDIVGSSIFVQGFSATDATGSESVTLQFRYSAKLNDFELIGREVASRDDESDSSYLVSTNYLTKYELHSRRSGIQHKELKVKLKNSKVFRLQGFDCSSLDAVHSGFHINKKMQIEEQ